MDYKILVSVNVEEIKKSETEGKEKILKINVTEEEGALDTAWQEKCHALFLAAETIARQNDGSILDVLPIFTDFLEKERGNR